MATTPSYFPIPYAIASPHHTQIHGLPANTTPIHHHRPGFVPSPAYMPPPAPAYAPPPPVPYPPSAQAYGPFGYYPAAATPPTWPPPAFPYAAPLPYFPTPNNGNDNGPFPPTATAEIRDDPAVGCVSNGSLGPCLSSLLEEQGRWQRMDLAQPNAAPTAPNCKRQPPQPWVESVPSSELAFRPQLTGETSTFVPPPAPPATSTSSPACSYFTEATAILNRVQRELSNLQARHRQARELSSYNTLQGEFAKLKSRVSQCAVSASKQSTRATPSSSPLQVIGTAPVAPKMFDTMPIPNSGCSKVFGKQSSAAASSSASSGSPLFESTASMLSYASTTASSLNSYFGESCAAPTPACDSVSVTHPSAVPSNRACVAQQVFCKMHTSSTTTAGSTTTRTSPPRHELLENSCVSNLSEQYLDEFPLHYGFDSLSRRSVFRADGSEHSYFTLPADYPLERVPAPVFDVYDDELDGCSNEFAQVFTGTPEQQPYEDAPQESEQSRKCFSRPSENPLPEVISEFALTTNVDVSVARYIKYKHGQCIPQVLEYSYTHDGAMGDVLLKEYKWNMLLSEEGREIWDPGTSVSTYPSWHPQLLVQQEGTVEHAPLQVHSRPAEIQPCVIQRAPAVTNCQVLDSALDMKFQQVPSVHAPSSIYLWLQRLTARITTEKPLSRVPIPEPTQWQSQVTSVSFVWDPGTRLLVHKSKWWFVYTEDMTNWYTNIKFNGVALWLFHSLPP